MNCRSAFTITIILLSIGGFVVSVYGFTYIIFEQFKPASCSTCKISEIVPNGQIYFACNCLDGQYINNTQLFYCPFNTTTSCNVGDIVPTVNWCPRLFIFNNPYLTQFNTCCVFCGYVVAILPLLFSFVGIFIAIIVIHNHYNRDNTCTKV